MISRKVLGAARELVARELGEAWASELHRRGVPRPVVELAGALAGVRAPLPVVAPLPRMAPVRVEVRAAPRAPGRVELAEVLDSSGAVVGHTTVEVGRG